jgi:parallel beta-helix repeat protein
MKFKVAIVSLIFVVSFLQMFTEMPQSASAASVAHGVIAINGNSEFATMAATEGWKGDGTISNPYFISGYDIDATGHSCGISIGNSTVYFVISNCSVNGASEYGIDLGTVQHALITHVSSHSNGGVGIRLHDTSSNNVVKRNSLSSNYFGGIILDNYCDNNLISYNNCSDPTVPNPILGTSAGIFLNNYCDYNRIEKNLCWNAWDGISLMYAEHNVIDNNSCQYSASNGISVMSGTMSCEFTNNNCSNNDKGFWLDPSTNTFSRNIVSNNQIGIHFSSGASMIFHNNFIGNVAHVDSGGATTLLWNASYPAGGNYWSGFTGADQFSGAGQNVAGADGIIDTPYQIDVSIQDNYPLKNPYPITFDIVSPVSTATVSGSVVTISSLDDVSGVNKTMYRVDNGSWQNYIAPINITQAGNHTVEYYSIDSSGNAEDVKSVNVSVQGGGGDTPSGTPGGIPMELIAIAIVVMIVIASVIILMLNRKKKKGKSEVTIPQSDSNKGKS